MALTEAQIAQLPDGVRQQYREQHKIKAAPTQEPKPSQPVETPEVRPRPVIHNPDLREPQGIDQASTEPQPKPQAEPPKPDQWEQRYRVMKGKYDKEVPGLANEVRQLRTTVQAQGDLIRRLEAQPPKPVEAPKPPEPSPMRLLNPEDYEQIGTQEGKLLVDTINSQATEISALRNTVASLHGELGQLRGTTETLSRNTERVVKDFGATRDRDFWSEVKRLEPDWETFNGGLDGNGADDLWAHYLEQIDEKTGEKNRVLAARVMQQGDAARLVSFAKEFKRQTGWKAPAQVGDGIPSQNDLLIEPDTVGGGRERQPKPKQESVVTLDQLNKAAMRAKTLRTPEAINEFNKLSAQYQGAR